MRASIRSRGCSRRLRQRIMVGTRARVYRHMTFVRVMDVPRRSASHHPLGQTPSADRKVAVSFCNCLNS